MKNEFTFPLSTLSSSDLLNRARSLVTEERRITLELIESLREIERRLLFAELGYGSIFEFVTRHLGLSEGSAQRRIQAMRLVRDVPEAKTVLESGELSLSNAARVQSFFQMEKKQEHPIGSSDMSLTKQDVIKQITGLSQRECEQKLYEISPQSVPRELKVVISEELYEKIQSGMDESPSKSSQLPPGVRVHLPRPNQRIVWHRADAQCEYEHEGHRCTSKFRLEIDHCTPLALGGSNSLDNLRLLCRTHNIQQARKKIV